MNEKKIGMKHFNHPAIVLIDEFCTHYNNRDTKHLLSLFCKKPTFILWNSDEVGDDIHDFKEQIQHDWNSTEKSTLALSSAPTLSNIPMCWALGVFTLTAKTNEELHTYIQLKGNLYGVKEGNTWKINEIRFIPKFIPSSLQNNEG